MSVIKSCSASSDFRRTNSMCKFCTYSHPDYDCPYYEVDEIDDEDIDYDDIDDNEFNLDY